MCLFTITKGLPALLILFLSLTACELLQQKDGEKCNLFEQGLNQSQCHNNKLSSIIQNIKERDILSKYDNSRITSRALRNNNAYSRNVERQREERNYFQRLESKPKINQRNIIRSEIQRDEYRISRVSNFINKNEPRVTSTRNTNKNQREKVRFSRERTLIQQLENEPRNNQRNLREENREVTNRISRERNLLENLKTEPRVLFTRNTNRNQREEVRSLRERIFTQRLENESRSSRNNKRNLREENRRDTNRISRDRNLMENLETEPRVLSTRNTNKNQREEVGSSRERTLIRRLENESRSSRNNQRNLREENQRDQIRTTPRLENISELSRHHLGKNSKNGKISGLTRHVRINTDLTWSFLDSTRRYLDNRSVRSEMIDKRNLREKSNSRLRATSSNEQEERRLERNTRATKESGRNSVKRFARVNTDNNNERENTDVKINDKKITRNIQRDFKLTRDNENISYRKRIQNREVRIYRGFKSETRNQIRREKTERFNRENIRNVDATYPRNLEREIEKDINRARQDLRTRMDDRSGSIEKESPSVNADETYSNDTSMGLQLLMGTLIIGQLLFSTSEGRKNGFFNSIRNLKIKAM